MVPSQGPQKPTLEQVVERALREAGELPPAAQARIREDLRLQFEYPDEYVAYIDSRNVRNRARQFVRRVISHSKSLPSIHEAIGLLSPEDRARVVIRYASDPCPPELDTHHDLPITREGMPWPGK